MGNHFNLIWMAIVNWLQKKKKLWEPLFVKIFRTLWHWFSVGICQYSKLLHLTNNRYISGSRESWEKNIWSRSPVLWLETSGEWEVWCSGRAQVEKPLHVVVIHRVPTAAANTTVAHHPPAAGACNKNSCYDARVCHRCRLWNKNTQARGRHLPIKVHSVWGTS